MKNLGSMLFLSAIILAGLFNETVAQYGKSKQARSESSQNLSAGGITPREIERKTFKELIKLPFYGVFDHIAFKVDDDAVTLVGKVAVARNKRDAEHAIRRIAGVKTVVNRIEVLPPSVFDNRIRRRTFRELSAKGLFRYLQEPNPSVRIIVDRGRIELEGFIANRGDYNLMNILARGITDVFAVQNNLVVENEGAR